MPLVEIDRRHIDRRTIVELRRPRGLVPDVVVMTTSTPVFNRTVEVWDEGPGARLATQKGALQVLLWVVVTAVVIFLTVLTLRLARHEGSDTD